MTQDLWQLQHAIITAERNLTESVTIADWPTWMRYLLVGLDAYCKDWGYDADGMLLAIRDVIDARLQAGEW